MTRLQIINRLNIITSNSNFVYIISRIVLRDFCGTLNELSSKNVHDHLNYNEVRFLMGLWIKNWNFSEIEDYENEGELMEEIYRLMNQLHYTFLPSFPKVSFSESPFNFPFDGLFFQEAMFYSGTGAYDYQYTKWVSTKYKYDKNWLQEKKSIDIDLLADFYKSIKILLQVKLNKLKFNKGGIV